MIWKPKTQKYVNISISQHLIFLFVVIEFFSFKDLVMS